MPELIAAVFGALGGVALGAFLARRNERRATSERLLTEALDDIVGGIADAASRVPGAQARYASGMARLALHGNAELARAFREWQETPDTGTTDGRRALAGAVQQARHDLGRGRLAEDVVATLLFGTHPSAEGEARN